MTNTSLPTPSPVSNSKRNRRSLLSILAMIIAGVLIVVFVAIQLIPVNRVNPPVTSTIKWDSPQTEALAKRACMDCHSNETVWPWYSYVAPASWLIYYDVQRGRRQLNLDSLAAGIGESRGGNNAQSNDLAYRLGQYLAEGGQQRGPGGEGDFPRQGGGNANGQGFQPPAGEFRGGFNIADRLAEQIQQNRMPPANYLLIHANAKLTDAEKQQLIQGLQKTFGQASTTP